MHRRLAGLLLAAGILFAGLVGRLVYLKGAGPALAAAAGVEVEVFQHFPVPEELVMAASTAAPGAEVAVPLVLQAGYDEAGRRLQKAGLLMEAYGDVRGVVIRQDPVAGERIMVGSTVRVWMVNTK